jgi:hypothetical protein
MSGKQLKYVRTAKGFLVFACLAATHKDIAYACGWPKLSAGFIDWDVDGRPLCMGESETLGIGSREDDTEALRAEWGMDTPAAPITLTPAMKADAALFEGEHFTVFATPQETAL